jgi:hypothetical protein
MEINVNYLGVTFNRLTIIADAGRLPDGRRAVMCSNGGAKTCAGFVWSYT